jgi:hypothetical protein
LLNFRDILENIKKSQGAKSAEHGGWETTVIFLAAKDCCYFCSSVSNQHTNFMEIFHTFKSSLRIHWHVAFRMNM